MLCKSQRRHVFAVLVLPLALGGLPVRAHARASPLELASLEPAGTTIDVPAMDSSATDLSAGPVQGAPRLHIELARGLG